MSSHVAKVFAFLCTVATISSWTGGHLQLLPNGFKVEFFLLSNSIGHSDLRSHPIQFA